MFVPNLKRIAPFVQQLLSSQNFEIGSRDPKAPFIAQQRNSTQLDVELS